MQYAQRVILNEDRTTKPAQLHGILQQAKIFGPISAGHIEYCGNKIRCLDLCSLQSAHYRKLDVGNGQGSRIRPVSSSPSVVDITAPTSPCAQDRPIKGSYKRDSFRIPSINAQYALHTQASFPPTGVSAQVNTACGQQPSHHKSLELYVARRLTGDLPVREWHPCGCHSTLPRQLMRGTHRASAPDRAHAVAYVPAQEGPHRCDPRSRQPRPLNHRGSRRWRPGWER